MKNGIQQMNSLENDVKNIAIHVKSLLQSSDFSPEEQSAWLTVLPLMSFEDLEKFLEILERSITKRALQESEDIAMQSLALFHAKNIGLHASIASADHELQRISDTFTALEQAGGRSS